MDLYLDRLLDLPSTTVESFTEEENKRCSLSDRLFPRSLFVDGFNVGAIHELPLLR